MRRSDVKVAHYRSARHHWRRAVPVVPYPGATVSGAVAAGGMELQSVRRVSVVLVVAFVVGVGVQSACGGDREVHIPTGQAMAFPGLFQIPAPVSPRPTAEPFHVPTPALTASAIPAPTAGWSHASTPVVTASATPTPTATSPHASTPAATASAASVPTAAPSRTSTPEVIASATPTAAPTRIREPDTASRAQASRTRRVEVPGLIPVPARGNPEAECEALADSYTAAHKFYQSGTATSSTAWNDYLNAHNSGQADRAWVSRLQQSYHRLSANLDRSLATMAASEQAAQDFVALQKGRCDLDQSTGSRYLPMPPPQG